MDKYYLYDYPSRKYRLKTNIRNYVGNSSFNAAVRLVSRIKRDNSPAGRVLPVFVFMMPEGQGLKTAARILAARISGKTPDDKRPRFSASYYKLTPEDASLNIPGTINEILRTLRVGDSAGKFFCVVDLDIYTGKKIYDAIVLKLLKLISDLRGERTFILRIAPMERDIVRNMLDYISSYIPVRLIEFPELSEDDALEYAKGRLYDYYNAVFADGAEESFRLYYLRHINRGKYFGFATLKKICAELYFRAMAESEGGTELSEDAAGPLIIDKRHIEYYYGRFRPDESNGGAMSELNEMIGLSYIKEQIGELVKTAQYKKKTGINDGRTLHLMFTGQPGTGKTVVARLLGSILKDCGILKHGRLIEVGRKDLIGEYMGQTALKTIDVCHMAMGGVLFIDEAYSLAKADNDRYGFEQEALTTLLAEMENNRFDFVVIMAGYKEEMDQLCKTNAGLRDRFAFRIDFPSYTRDELTDIFRLQLRKRGYVLSPEADNEAELYFKHLPNSVILDKNFSNARFVRNLTERIISKISLRVINEHSADNADTVLTRDLSAALCDQDFKKLNSGGNVRLIGF